MTDVLKLKLKVAVTLLTYMFLTGMWVGSKTSGYDEKFLSITKDVEKAYEEIAVLELKGDDRWTGTQQEQYKGWQDERDQRQDERIRELMDLCTKK